MTLSLTDIIQEQVENQTVKLEDTRVAGYDGITISAIRDFITIAQVAYAKLEVVTVNSGDHLISMWPLNAGFR